MDWYPHYIRDYRRDTRHLTTLEHGAYRLLLDAYMDDQRALPDDDAILAKIAGLSLEDWRPISARVRAFFIAAAGLLRHKRCEHELGAQSKKRVRWQKYQSASRRRKALKKKETDDADNQHVRCNRTVEDKTVEKKERGRGAEAPQPTNGATTNGRSAGRGQRLPPDWQPSPEDTHFAEQLGLDSLAVAARFRDYWAAAPGQKGCKADWPATWRNWCRKDIESGKSGGGRQVPVSTVAAFGRVIDD